MRHRPYGPLLAFLLAVPAAASLFDLEADIRQERTSLRSSAESASANMRYLTALALEKEKVDLLKKQVDLAAADAEQAARLARSLDSRCQGGFSEIEDIALGYRNASPEKTLAFLSSSLDDARALWRQLSSQQQTAAGVREDAAREAVDLERRSEELLSDAKRALDSAEARIRALREPADRMQSRYRQARSLKDEIQKAAAPAARARIDALGTPPESEQRGRASQKIEDFRRPMNPFYLAASVILNRTEDFGRVWTTFYKASRDFDSSRASAEAELRDARRLLAEEREAVSRLRSLPRGR